MLLIFNISSRVFLPWKKNKSWILKSILVTLRNKKICWAPSGVWPRLEKGAVKVAPGTQYTRSNRGSRVNMIPAPQPEKRYTSYRTPGRQGGPPGQLEENDQAGRVLLVLVALEGVPCRRIFPRMKSCTAWVHFQRKYSTYRHELNHAQPAGASGVCAQLK